LEVSLIDDNADDDDDDDDDAATTTTTTTTKSFVRMFVRSFVYRLVVS